MSDTVYICHSDTFFIDGSKPNNSIAGITATKPGGYHDWRGSIIAYGKVELGIHQITCKDLDMKDFQHITDYFVSYVYTPIPATQQSIDTVVKGVKTNCLGDMKMSNKIHFEAIDISSTDSTFSNYDTSDIAKHIGLLIFTRRCPPDPS